jgi:hypothetical protein
MGWEANNIVEKPAVSSFSIYTEDGGYMLLRNVDIYKFTAS